MRTANLLEHLVDHEVARATHGLCRHCGGWPRPAHEAADYAVARRGRRLKQTRSATRQPQPRPAPGATPAGGRGLADFRGWSGPVSLKQVLKAARRIDQYLANRGGRSARFPPALVPAHLRPFFDPRGQQLYRISASGYDRPLDIGMTGRSIGLRLYQHYYLPRQIRSPALKGMLRSGQYRDMGNKKLRRILRKQTPQQIVVQRGDVTGGNSDRRYTHAHEILLQKGERTVLYDPRTTTFENDPGA